MPRHVSINESNVHKAEEKFEEKEAAAEAAASKKDGARGRDASKRDRFKESWKVPPRYEVKQLLGSGSYGSVCEAKDREKKRSVAIKQAKHLLDDLIDGKRILREIAILSKLAHKHIVEIYDIIVPNDLVKFNELYMVLEICDSDLKKLCRAEVTLNSVHVTSLLYNLLIGLYYLHSAGIWHRDLKPANCLVNEDCCVKICDFGLARAVGGKSGSRALYDEANDAQAGQKRHLTGHVVTRWYRAPELILLQEDYSEAIDVWSVACIYAELLGMLDGTKYKDRAPLFPGQTCFPLSPHEGHKTDTKYYTKGMRDQLSMICGLIGTPSEEDLEQIEGEDARCYMQCFPKREGTGVKAKFGHLDSAGSDLLEQMLVFNPAKRISVAKALNHRLFSKVRDIKKETVAQSPIILDFEEEENLEEPLLRKYFLQEIRKYHPEVPELDFLT